MKGPLANRALLILLDATVFLAIGLIMTQFSLFGVSDLFDKHAHNLVNQILGPYYARFTRLPDVEDAANLKALESTSSEGIRVGDPSATEETVPTGQQLITVVTVTDFDLREANETWPARYGYHALVLDEIANMEPALIFIDVHFGKRHEHDETLGLLQDFLGVGATSPKNRPKDERGRPRILLAGDPNRCDGGIIEEILGGRNDRIAMAPRATDLEDQHDRRYPLRAGLLGRSECHKRSVALAAYAHVLSGASNGSDTGDEESLEILDQFEDDMVVVWGNHSAAANAVTRHCREDAPPWDLLIERVNGSPSEFKSDCPYHTTLHAGLVLDSTKRDWVQSLIQGRYVFYGIDRHYSHDHVLPPTHTRLPAVHLHAMAFDNLLTYGRHYIRHEDARKAPAFLTVALLLLVLGIGRGLTRATYRAESPHGNGTGYRWCFRKAVGFVVRFAAWAVLFTVLAIVLWPFLENLTATQVLETRMGCVGLLAGGVALSCACLGTTHNKWRASIRRILIVGWIAIGTTSGLAAVVLYEYATYSVVPEKGLGILLTALLSISTLYNQLEDWAYAWFSASPHAQPSATETGASNGPG